MAAGCHAGWRGAGELADRRFCRRNTHADGDERAQNSGEPAADRDAGGGHAYAYAYADADTRPADAARRDHPPTPVPAAPKPTVAGSPAASRAGGRRPATWPAAPAGATTQSGVATRPATAGRAGATGQPGGATQPGAGTKPRATTQSGVATQPATAGRPGASRASLGRRLSPARRVRQRRRRLTARPARPLPGAAPSMARRSSMPMPTGSSATLNPGSPTSTSS